MEIVPECNLVIKTCRNGTKERNAILLATEVDYMLNFQTTKLPMPRLLFKYIAYNQENGIVRL